MNKLEHIYEKPEFGEPWFNFHSLYNYVVEKYPSGSTFVEIGSWKGKSSAYMCVEIANSNKDINFFCVDTWAGSKEHFVDYADISNENIYGIFMTNMKDVKNYFSPYRMTSLQAASLFDDKSIDFAFIDASHEYEDVLNDIRAWYPKIKPGGMLAGHDYDDVWPGVKKAVQECFNNPFINANCWAVHVNE
jgi:hypothetical protein